MTRWVRKSLVHAKLAERVLIQITYAISIAEPLSININKYGTSDKTNEELLEIIKII